MAITNVAFNGFSAEGIHFLRDLAENNNKPWFEANKDIYLTAVQAPAVALVATLGAQLHERFPEIHYDTRTNGTGSLMRIYRDTRFSADKSPYKTNVAMMFTSGQAGKMAAPGFGLQLTPERVDLVAGLFDFAPPVLATYRAAVLDDDLGAQLEQAAAAVRNAGDYTISGEGYKRVPAGVPADHPRAGWLKYKGLHVFAPPIAIEVAQTPALVEVALAHFVAMAPVQQWLVRMLA
jgi:uncharacterized protein (TIGR02453 family)